MSAGAVSPPTTITKTTDTAVEAGTRIQGTVAEVRAVLSVRGAVTGLLSGSWALAGMGCRCVGRLLHWAWEQSATDPEAQAAVQAHAEKEAKVRAKWAKRRAKQGEETEEGEDGEAKELEALGAAPSGRRPFLEALAYLALGGLLAAGAAGTAAVLLAPHVGLLAPWQPVIVSVGGLAWMAAAWMVAPPPEPVPGEDAEVQEQEDGQDDAVDEADRGTALLLHVVGALAAAESAGRAGLHLDAVLESAVEAGLLAEGTELPVMRAWVEATGLPVADKVGYRIDGKPVTRVGFKIAAVTEALEMTPTALLATRSETPAGEAPAAAVRPVAEPPAETPVKASPEVSAPAVLRLIPGGLLDPDPAPSPPLSQESAQEAR
ncbi:hypothetical protein PV518_17735 [Streptomyces sp. ND04-05B]|uniref:hypothetical protein n=1 Tax=Streptomyces sp. ND04-05B TaxID=3028693 RepID=UPI0029BE3EC6|nr:hypothetical protein [Streptomyces sp. ND04-05B]MDX3064002.1 hypothetical protein [Streptomyces sp. ND04-05B]